MFVLLVMLLCGLSAPAPVTSTPPTSDPDEGCVLPKYPEGGTYVIPRFPKLGPGQPVPQYSYLRYSCNLGYDLSTSVFPVCEKSAWSPEPSMITCNITCELETSNTVKFMCRDSNSLPIHCTNKIADGKPIYFICKQGYSRVEGNDGRMFCRGGQWDIPTPQCSPKRCRILQFPSVDFTCYNSRTVMACPKFLPYGSVITPSCKSGHVNPDHDIEDMTCVEDGRWNNTVPFCRPDCGLEKPIGGEQMVHGSTFKKDTFPWHVGIFQLDETTNTVEQICGGSIISSNIVVSAAHCFWDPVNYELKDESYYKVAAGKFLRSWDKDLRENLNFIQKSDVTKIYIPPHYGGDDQNQQNDLALLQLTTPFRLANSVRAVCYDLNDEKFDTFQTEVGRMGKVAGWGRTETGEPSEELKTLELPVIGYQECRDEMSKYRFSRYLTADKMCAGHLNGSAMCQHDSGGGLVFPSQDTKGNTRWYLRGVVSNGPLDDDKIHWRSDTYTAFTHIFKMGSWIKKTITHVTRSIYNDL